MSILAEISRAHDGGWEDRKQRWIVIGFFASVTIFYGAFFFTLFRWVTA